MVSSLQFQDQTIVVSHIDCKIEVDSCAKHPVVLISHIDCWVVVDSCDESLNVSPHKFDVSLVKMDMGHTTRCKMHVKLTPLVATQAMGH